MKSEQKKIIVIVGSRTELIALAPVIHTLQNSNHGIAVSVISTASQNELSEDIFTACKIQPNYHLTASNKRGSLNTEAHLLLEKLDYVFAVEKPDMVIVFGNSPMIFIACLAAFQLSIPMAHMEAEEGSPAHRSLTDAVHRKLISTVSNLHFTANQQGSKRLLKEGISNHSITCTGSTILESLQQLIQSQIDFNAGTLSEIVNPKKRSVLLSITHWSDLNDRLTKLFSSVKKLSAQHRDVNFIIAVERKVSEEMTRGEKWNSNILFIQPLRYADLINLSARSIAVITDSHEHQSECAALCIPSILLSTTVDSQKILPHSKLKWNTSGKEELPTLLHTILVKTRIAKKIQNNLKIRGAKKASERIAITVLHYLGVTQKKMRLSRPGN